MSAGRSAFLDPRLALVASLSAAGWAGLALHLLANDLPGAVAASGPGMGVVEWLRARLAGDLSLPDFASALCLVAPDAWTLGDFSRALAMWLLMVLAMMLPLAPRAGGADLGNQIAFVAGYITSCLPLAVLGVALQFSLHRAGLLDAYLVSSSRALDALLLVIAAICLRLRALARAPARPAAPATFGGGVSAGIVAVRDCAPPMLLMFVFGLMNLVFMALLTAAMLLSRGRGSVFSQCAKEGS